MEPRRSWTPPQGGGGMHTIQMPPTNGVVQEDDASSNLASMIKALVIGGLLIAIYFLYNSERGSTPTPTLLSPEEARRRRLEKLEQQQKDAAKPKPQNTTVKPNSSQAQKTEPKTTTPTETKPTAPATTIPPPEPTLPPPQQEEDDDDMQILRLKRPPPSEAPPLPQKQQQASAAAKTVVDNNKPVDKTSDQKTVPAQETTTSKKRKPSAAKPPRETLLQALSSITNTTVSTPSCPPPPPSATKKKTTTTVRIPDHALPATLAWKDLSSKGNGQQLWEPFRSQLTKKPTTTSSYGPARAQDRRLYKASEWHSKSKTWVRDHASQLLSEEAKAALAGVLEGFQKWIVETVVEQLRVDVSNLPAIASASMEEVEEDDDDVDMGLFADESYGGAVSTTGVVVQPKKEDEDDDDKTLFGELLFLLSHADGPKVLTKPFLAQLARSYDGKQPNTSSLGKVLLEQCLQRLPSPHQSTKLEYEKTHKHVNALINLLTLSPSAVKALAGTYDDNTTNSNNTEGKTWEEQSRLRALFCLAAWTVPRFRPNASANTNNERPNPNDLLPAAYHAGLVQAMGPAFPVALYAHDYEDAKRTYHSATKNAQSVFRAARTAGALALKKLAASSSEGKRKGGLVLDWILAVLRTNEPLVDLLQSDLLQADSAQALCAGRPFLLGLTVSLLQMCGTNLAAKLQEAGVEAFDVAYFRKEEEPGKDSKATGIVVASPERCLVDNTNDTAAANRPRPPERFAGATEFFFLTAALLRIALFPGIRVDEEFRSRFRHLFASIHNLADQHYTQEQLQQVRPASMVQMQKAGAVVLGWQAFVDDPDLSRTITAFSLLQLRWVSLAVNNNGKDGGAVAAASLIPEWFVKLPSQWLAHVAMTTPHLLEPRQGIEAVEYATKILQTGTQKSSASSSSSSKGFSPPVLCQLIRIAGAFVNSGVRRARHREKAKSSRPRRGFRNNNNNNPQQDQDEDFETDIIDDRTLDIYTSFDARDLGITVFTNEFVAQHLPSTLMRAYMAMDAVEGMDVEREHHFEKFQVKSEVADLLLRLWCHPNGQSRAALVGKNLDEVILNEFASSLAGSVGFLLDQVCQFILDIRDINEEGSRNGGGLTPRDAAASDHHAKFLSSSLHACRRLLYILCSFSKEEKIAAVLGGKLLPSKKKADATVVKSAAPDLAHMFLNMVERITDKDGGIHPELEAQQLQPEERSAAILSHLGSIAPAQLQEKLEYLLHARRFALLEYGLDVSLLTHQFLALAARWHLAAVSVDKEGKRTSKFLEAVVASDICDSKRLRNVLRRLVGTPKEMSGTETDNAEYILTRDGHVDLTIWKEKYKFEGTGPDKGKGRKRTAKQDRMSHSDLDSLVEAKDIEVFLNDLEAMEASKSSYAVDARWGTAQMRDLEENVFSTGDLLTDDDYSESLKEWVVSSDSFLSNAGNGSFAHSYDSIVRGRGAGAMGSGRVLAREARKCFRLIPKPHPNTSVFVCFAEERSDLCKAIIIGAADTPFSMGMFEFDILFPTNYPQSPPLFNFKTTGDGRTRISSNLYNDGKVCISILGTYQADNDSQRWNASTSNLAMVLASLQTQLLGDAEPYFSDGFAHESVRGTPAGERGSERFNNKNRLHTLRYGIIAPLRHPPLGFEDVTKQHFVLCRKRVLAQARLWTIESQGTPLYNSFVRAYEELITLLASDDLVRYKAPGQTENKVWGAVPLNAKEFEALEEVDGAFLEQHGQVLEGCLAEDAKPAAREGNSSSASASAVVAAAAPSNFGLEQQAPPSHSTNQIPAGYNPWATGGTVVAASASGGGDNNDDDGFDDMYD